MEVVIQSKEKTKLCVRDVVRTRSEDSELVGCSSQPRKPRTRSRDVTLWGNAAWTRLVLGIPISRTEGALHDVDCIFEPFPCFIELSTGKNKAFGRGHCVCVAPLSLPVPDAFNILGEEADRKIHRMSMVVRYVGNGHKDICILMSTLKASGRAAVDCYQFAFNPEVLLGASILPVALVIMVCLRDVLELECKLRLCLMFKHLLLCE